MQELPVRLREDAISDLEEIATYTASKTGSKRLALEYIRRIEARCMKIGKVPFGAPERKDLDTGIRIAAFERSAVIAYQVLPDCVEIINVFHGGRDFETLLGGA